jgi:hypothetical protein
MTAVSLGQAPTPQSTADLRIFLPLPTSEATPACETPGPTGSVGPMPPAPPAFPAFPAYMCRSSIYVCVYVCHVRVPELSMRARAHQRPPERTFVHAEQGWPAPAGCCGSAPTSPPRSESVRSAWRVWRDGGRLPRCGGVEAGQHARRRSRRWAQSATRGSPIPLAETSAGRNGAPGRDARQKDSRASPEPGPVARQSLTARG